MFNQNLTTPQHPDEYITITLKFGYNSIAGDDIAILQFDEPVVYSAYIRPLCVVGSRDVFTPTSQCYTAGWGQFQPEGNVIHVKSGVSIFRAVVQFVILSKLIIHC